MQTTTTSSWSPVLDTSGLSVRVRALATNVTELMLAMDFKAL